MKKLILIILIASSFSSFSQNEPILKSKKGNYILPQPGDWGISIDANPFLSYIGNMFFINGINNPPVFDFHNFDQGLSFRYFKEEKYALRAGFNLQNRYESEMFKVDDLNPDAGPGSQVSEFKRSSFFGINLNFGIEYRKGNGRLQGLYGVQGLLGYETGERAWYVYGNSMEHYAANTSTTRETRNPSSAPVLRFGAMGFIGAEYFFAPKMSLGSELYLTAVYNNQMSYTKTTEVWNATDTKSEFVKTVEEQRINSFDFFMNNMGGKLKLSLYF